MGTILPGRPPIKIGGEWRTRGKGPDPDIEVRVAYALLHLDSNLDFLDSVKVTQFRVTRRKDGWLVMLKGLRGKRKLVAFVDAETFRDALTVAATMSDCQYIPWKTDDWEPPR